MTKKQKNIFIGNAKNITPSETPKNLRIVFESTIGNKEHGKKICNKSLFHL